jgi:hypothetical protein
MPRRAQSEGDRFSSGGYTGQRDEVDSRGQVSCHGLVVRRKDVQGSVASSRPLQVHALGDIDERCCPRLVSRFNATSPIEALRD